MFKKFSFFFASVFVSFSIGLYVGTNWVLDMQRNEPQKFEALAKWRAESVK